MKELTLKKLLAIAAELESFDPLDGLACACAAQAIAQDIKAAVIDLEACES